MKMIIASTCFALFLTAAFFSSCVQSKFDKNLIPGYTEYQNCLKACDALEAQYTAQYNQCNQGCPATPHLEHCFHLPTEEQRLACISEELEPVADCNKCYQDYIKHMQEVADCRQQCLDEYNKKFEVLEQ